MKKIFLITLMSLIIVLMAGIVYGAVTCVFDQTATTAGTSSTYIRGTAKNLSATLTVGDEGINATTSVISAGATGCTITGALTFNATDNQSYMNTTVDTTAMKDNTTCTFTMTVKNITQETLANCTRAYISDNTVPVTTLSSPADLSKDTDGSITFTYNCSNSSSSTLYVEGTAYTMTESSGVCTYTGTWATNGFHSHYIIASDGLNTTTSSSSQVETRRPGGIIYDEKGEIMAGTATVKSGNTVANIVNGFFDFVFGIFDTIFSIFK